MCVLPQCRLTPANYKAASGGDDTLFAVNFATCLDALKFGSEACPGVSSATDFSGTPGSSIKITSEDYIGNDTWVKLL